MRSLYELISSNRSEEEQLRVLINLFDYRLCDAKKHLAWLKKNDDTIKDGGEIHVRCKDA